MSDLLEALHTPLLEEVSGLELASQGLRGQLDLRFGLLAFHIDHDDAEDALRVAVRIPPPLGGGPEFAVFCLSLNAQSLHAKFGLDDSGFLLVHADLSAPRDVDVDLLRDEIRDCIDAIADLIDESLCPYLLERKLGTPAQLERWSGVE